MESATSNYQLFRECFSNEFLQRLTTKQPMPKARRAKRGRGSSAKMATRKDVAPEDANRGQDASDSEDLSDFIEYLASEIYESLPLELQTLSYGKLQEDPSLRDRYDPNEAALSTSALSERLLASVPPSVSESIAAYELLASDSSFPPLFTSAMAEYITSATAAPPAWSSTRTSECEICGRDWVPLSYHHLIPKSTHERVLKRKWHDEWMLDSVAWLCRACHSFVHRCEGNEVLAKDYYTVDLLTAREDVQQWAKWVGRIRWKAT